MPGLTEKQICRNGAVSRSAVTALAFFCTLVSVTAVAQENTAKDAIALEGTTIIGNRELPTVLSIVPWKRARPGDRIVRPFSSLHDETLAPLDPPVLRRQLRYFQAPGRGISSQPEKE